MSESKHQIYIVDYWIPFPGSEYGGLIIVIAKSDEEAVELLKNDKECILDYPEHNIKIKEYVKKSQRFPLFGEQESRIVEKFLT